jgi:hypothetical protein
LQTHFSENKHIIRKSKYWSWEETFWFWYFDGWWYEIFASPWSQNYVSVFSASYQIYYWNNTEFACVIKAFAAWPIFQKINTLYEKASIEVERKHFDFDILMGGDMKFLQLVLGLGGCLCNYSCPWYRVHKNHKRADNILLPSPSTSILAFSYNVFIFWKMGLQASFKWS